MAYTAYARFVALASPPTSTAAVKADADLPKTGQDDDLATVNTNTKYPSKDGWFPVLSLEYSAAASVESGSGKSTGNVKETAVKLVKNTGPLTAITWRAHFNRAPFDMERVLLDQKGGGTAEEVSKLTFRNAVFSSLRNFTGDPRLNSLASSIGASTTDTKELDELCFVYQAVEMKHHGKEVKLTLQGETK